jgi:malate synthase
VPHGSVRATVLVETILAAFEMEEILYELRDHAAGLNAGGGTTSSPPSRSSARGRRADPPRPRAGDDDRAVHARLHRAARATCHARARTPIGGMAAFIPNRRDPQVTEPPWRRVRDDKLREAGDGFDGTWVAHPDLVPVAMQVFADALGDRPQPEGAPRDEVRVTAEQLADLHVPAGRSRTPASAST